MGRILGRLAFLQGHDPRHGITDDELYSTSGILVLEACMASSAGCLCSNYESMIQVCFGCVGPSVYANRIVYEVVTTVILL